MATLYYCVWNTKYYQNHINYVQFPLKLKSLVHFEHSLVHFPDALK